LYRDKNNVKKVYQPRTNAVKHDKGDLARDCHSILAMWRNHISQLLNVLGVNAVKAERKTYCSAPRA